MSLMKKLIAPLVIACVAAAGAAGIVLASGGPPATDLTADHYTYESTLLPAPVVGLKAGHAANGAVNNSTRIGSNWPDVWAGARYQTRVSFYDECGVVSTKKPPVYGSKRGYHSSYSRMTGLSRALATDPAIEYTRSQYRIITPHHADIGGATYGPWSDYSLYLRVRNDTTPGDIGQTYGQPIKLARAESGDCVD